MEPTRFQVHVRVLTVLAFACLASACGDSAALNGPGGAGADAASAEGGSSNPGGPLDATADTRTPATDALAFDAGAVVDARVARDGDIPEVPSGVGCPGPRRVPWAPLRRLTTIEYRRTLRDLIGLQTLTTPLPREFSTDGFEGRVESQFVDLPLVEAWDKAASEGAAFLIKQPRFLTCAPTDVDEGCARRFIETFGHRVFRRPLWPGEITSYVDLFVLVRRLGDPADALGAVIRALLQSPNFLYRPELSRMETGPGVLALNGHEVATRLSYLLWGSLPDLPLFEAAQADQLRTADQVEQQARRMLADPRARDGVRDFFRQWLEIAHVVDVTKDMTRFPRWRPGLAQAMRDEAYLSIERVFFEGDARLQTLLTGRDSVLNADLANLYGVTTLIGTAWQPATLPANRAGLLTQGWFLAARGSHIDSGPVGRGIFVRQRLLCSQVPPPPPDIQVTTPTPRPDATTRELYGMHTSNPACVGCHTLMDPLGFAFENYDSIGAFRATENGKPIDSSGQLVASDIDGTFKDGIELGARLARSNQVHGCVTKFWFEAVLGRGEEAPDRCHIDGLADQFKRAGGDLRVLLLGLVRSDFFRFRAIAPLTPLRLEPLISDPVAARTVDKAVFDLLARELRQLSEAVTHPADRQRLDRHVEAMRDFERRSSMP